jgi:hypothetical protein
MAKDNPHGATVQYKVLLKPTDIGLLVMKRMERPHLDKSAELRRLIELGYAAEQAGFILDGTVLRHAGRMWDTQPDLKRPGHESALAESSVNGTTPNPRPARPKSKTESAELSTNEASGGVVQQTGQSNSTPGETSGLRRNLRGLSG